jgi:hypothetical protein
MHMNAASAQIRLVSDSFFSSAKRNLIGSKWIPAPAATN